MEPKNTNKTWIQFQILMNTRLHNSFPKISLRTVHPVIGIGWLTPLYLPWIIHSKSAATLDYGPVPTLTGGGAHRYWLAEGASCYRHFSPARNFFPRHDRLIPADPVTAWVWFRGIGQFAQLFQLSSAVSVFCTSCDVLAYIWNVEWFQADYRNLAFVNAGEHLFINF